MKHLLFLLIIFISQILIAQQKVGIGTLSPLATLHVKGNQRIGGNSSNMRFDSLTGRIEWVNCNLYVPVTQALMKHSAAGDGLFYNNSGGINGQLEYRNILGNPVFYTNFLNGKGYFKGPLGIATTTPLAGLHVADSSVLFSAMGDIPFSAAPPPQSSGGRRMMWYPDKAAFRAGYVSSDGWDQINVGNYSFAAGNNTYAVGNYSTAFGTDAIANGLVATAIGNAPAASGDYSTAIGTNAIADGDFSTAMGLNTQAIGAGSTALGSSTTANGAYTTAMGYQTTAYGDFSMALGQATFAGGENSTAMGVSTYAGSNATAMGVLTSAIGFASTAMGRYTEAGGYYSTSMGDSTRALGDHSTSGGHRTEASGYVSVALGNNTYAKANGAMTIGTYNDNTDSPSPFYHAPTDRLFQIGNGYDFFGITRSNAFTVLRNGNIGIGTTAADFPLSFDQDLGDKISLWSNSTNSYGFGIQGGLLQIHTDVSYADVAFGYGSSDAFFETMRIKGDGTVGIGTTTPNQMLDVNGNIQCWQVVETSDRRLKRDIVPMQNALPRITQLNGYNYYWKKEDIDNTMQAGVIAQEVQRLFPELVKEDDEGMLSVNYSGFIPVLIESVKEQQQQILDQQRQIDELKDLLLESVAKK